MSDQHKVLRAMKYLNENHIARIIVLTGPGVVINKLVRTAGAPDSVVLATSALFVIGLALYVCWSFFYKRVVGVEETEDEEEPAAEEVNEAQIIPGQLHANLVTELVTMCEGDAALALDLIHTEVRVNPNANYLAAIEMAHRRKVMVR